MRLLQWDTQIFYLDHVTLNATNCVHLPFPTEIFEVSDFFQVKLPEIKEEAMCINMCLNSQYMEFWILKFYASAGLLRRENTLYD